MTISRKLIFRKPARCIAVLVIPVPTAMAGRSCITGGDAVQPGFIPARDFPILVFNAMPGMAALLAIFRRQRLSRHCREVSRVRNCLLFLSFPLCATMQTAVHVNNPLIPFSHPDKYPSPLQIPSPAGEG